MGIIAIIGAVIQLIYLILSNKFEKDKELKKKKEEIIKELENGIKKRDASAVNLIINRAARLRK